MNHEDSEKSTIEKNRNSHFVFSSYCLCVFVVFFFLFRGRRTVALNAYKKATTLMAE